MGLGYPAGRCLNPAGPGARPAERAGRALGKSKDSMKWREIAYNFRHIRNKAGFSAGLDRFHSLDEAEF